MFVCHQFVKTTEKINVLKFCLEYPTPTADPSVKEIDTIMTGRRREEAIKTSAAGFPSAASLPAAGRNTRRPDDVIRRE